MEWLNNVHFIRPLWLLALLPMLVTIWLIRVRRQSRGEWQQVIDPLLLPYLLDDDTTTEQRPRNMATLAMGLAAILTTLALAGPAWEKLPQPVQKNQNALVIMLDMSLSMGAQDLKPSRYVRAIQKVTDIVRARHDGQTALVVYAADAHTVTPLTDDSETIENLLPALSPFIMPGPGSRPDKAITLAQQLSANARVNHAQLLLITDGIQHKDIDRIKDVLDRQHSTLSVITLGTKEGAPIPMQDSGFLRDGNGTIVMPQLDTEPIRQLSQALNIEWQPMSLDDRDWQQLLTGINTNIDGNNSSTDDVAQTQSGQNQRTFDLWSDQGYWLILLLLPLTLLLFRRGVLLTLLLIPALWPDKSWALEWDDVWQTPDQQAAALLDSNPQQAAKTFENPDWQGTAAYRAGDYDSAAKAFAKGQLDARGQYNLGNAYAQSGNLDGAETAYEKALALQPDFPQASENLDAVRKAKQQQQQQQQKQKQDQQQKNDSSDQQQGDNSDKQNADQQNSDKNDGQSGDKSDGGQNSPQNDSQQNSANDKPGQNDDQTAQPGTADQQKSDDQTNNSSAHADENKEQNNDDAQKSATAAQADKDAANADDKTAIANTPDDAPSREQQEAMQQWLNRVPDQPGNLLQRKFLYQYRQKNEQESEDVLW